MRKYKQAPSEARGDILAAMIPHVAFDGWSQGAIRHTAKELDVAVEFIEMAFPGGAVEMVEAYLAGIDEKMLKVLKKKKLDKMRIRDRIRAAVVTRLEINDRHKDSQIVFPSADGPSTPGFRKGGLDRPRLADWCESLKVRWTG